MKWMNVVAGLATIVLGVAASPAAAQDGERWVKPCLVFSDFEAAGRATSVTGQMYEKMCDLVGNDLVAESCLKLDAIEEGALAKPGNQEFAALNAACDASIVAGPPPDLLADENDPPATAPTDDMPTTSDADLELAFWNSVKDSNDPAMFLAYLQKYPNGTFAPLASASLAALSQAPSEPVQVVPPVIVQEKVIVNRGPSLAARVQRQLKRVGCYGGAIDGVWGPNSRKAIRQFNRRTNRHLDPTRPAQRQISIIRQYNYRVCR